MLIFPNLTPQGNSHVMYNGSFYYHEQGHQRIIRYELSSGNTKSVDVPEVATDGNNYLYKESRDYIDLNTDENGLWAIYGLPSNNNTVVMKLDPWTLKVRLGVGGGEEKMEGGGR